MGTTPWPAQASGIDPVYAVKTWRYLRLAIVGLVIGLVVAIAFERSKVHPGCFQTSISGYYYTPVRGYFVGALVGIGACMVCLRGSTPVEDVLLNLAGMFAPVVALVPDPDPGSCTSFPATTLGRQINVANNITALLAVGALALLLAGVLLARTGATAPGLVGYAVAAGLVVATGLVFWRARSKFVENAHYAAALLMFACIVAIVCSNALGYKQKRNVRAVRNPYLAIALAMVGSLLGMYIASRTGWEYWIIVVEITLISLFAVFWIIQTVELWGSGVRRQHADAQASRRL